MSPAQPLIIDTQRQMVYLWTNTNKTIAQALQNGWYEHPIARSVSIIEGMSNYRIVRDVPVVPQDAVLIEKMHNLKNILGSDGQLKLYDEVMERIRDRMKLTEKRMQNKVALCDTVCTQGFAAFKTTLNVLVDNFKYALENNADRLELLFYHKMLEALLYQDNDGSAGINRYTYRWFLDDLFIKQMLRGSLQVCGSLTSLLEYAKHCPDKELVTKWRECIQLIDGLVAKQIITQDNVDKLTNLLALLEKVDGVSIWFATLFYQQVKNVAIDASTIEKIVTALTQDYTDATQEFILFIKATQDNIATAHTLMQQKLETVSAFESFWQELHRLLIYPLTNDQFIGEFAQVSFLSKLLMCKELQKTIDILDESIKLMKSSRLLSFSNKQYLFNLMLKDFLAVCKKWLTGLMPEHAIAYCYPWRLSYYLRDFDSLFGNIMRKTYFSESSYFQKSSNFSVQAAILGSNTAFDRHYPETPEDLFMLIHQNSIVAVSATYKSLFSISGNTLSDLVYMPELFRAMFEYVDIQDGTSKSLIGIAYDDTKINLLYNMPLNNHSATFQLMYNFVNQEVVLQVQYLGQSRNRWEQIAVLAAASPELSGLVLEGPIILDLQGSIVSCAWKVSTIEKLKTIMAYLKIMNDISFGDIQCISLASINKTNQSSSAIFRQILPLCGTRIKGSLQQNWRSIIGALR